MAQWYTQLVFKDDIFLGDSLAEWEEVEGETPPRLNGFQRFTAVIVSGYALYGIVHGYYALGIAHIGFDPASNKAYYLSEKSALHKEPVDTLSDLQKEAIRSWLINHYPAAWENSTITFKRALETERK